MEHEQALSVINTLQDQLAGIARSVINSLADNRMTTWEGMAIAMKAMALGSTVMTLVQTLPPEIRKDLLYCLEHGDWTMPPE